MTPFLFGKLPSHGDFVARGLDPAVEIAWDAWAGAEIEDARTRLGDDFEAAHDAAPPWGFVSGPGPLGETWRCGVAAASVDSSGRRYLVVAGQDGLTEAEAVFAGFSGALAAEGAIRRVLIEGLDADATIGLLSAEGALPEALAAAPVLQARAEAGVWWAFGDVVPPVASDSLPPGFIADSLSRIAILLKDAA